MISLSFFLFVTVKEHVRASPETLHLFTLKNISLTILGVTRLDLQLVDFVQRRICVAEIQLAAIIELQISTA